MRIFLKKSKNYTKDILEKVIHTIKWKFDYVVFRKRDLLVKITSDSFEKKIPIKAYTDSAGYDLFADEPELVLPNSRKVISTGIRMSIPKGYYAEIKPRSGLARNGIVAFNGTVDSGYLGLIYVLIFNFSDEEFFIRKGNRIAQIIF